MTSLTATYGLPDYGDQLIIEQTEYAPYTGRLTKYALAMLLANLMFNRDEEIPVDCGFDGKKFVTGVVIYPRTRELAFSAFISYGELGSGAMSEPVIEETLKLALNTEATVRYPAWEIVSTKWRGKVYDRDFAVIPPPPIIATGSGVRVAAPVYGSVLVRYRTRRYLYPLIVTRREESPENKYSTVFYAIYNELGGGIQWKELDPPPGADEFEGDCLYDGGDVSYEPPDDPDAPPPGGANRHILIDYCTQQVKSISVTTT